MRDEFLAATRQELIERCREKVALRPRRSGDNKEMEFGITFLSRSTDRNAQGGQEKRPGTEPGDFRAFGRQTINTDMAEGATRHGRELAQKGFTVDQVVHDYGDLCQSITELALERKAPFEMKDFHTLNRCLDDVIADAVTEFIRQRDFNTEDEHADVSNQRLGAFAHELRTCSTPPRSSSRRSREARWEWADRQGRC